MVAIAIRDTVYLHDFSVKHLELEEQTNDVDVITEYVINELLSYERKNFCKFIGAGVPTHLMRMAPTLCSQLWAKLDIISIAMKPDEDVHSHDRKGQTFWDVKDIDEQADSMARKSIM